MRGIGEVTDIVEKEMYTFVDTLNGDSLTCVPRGTAGIVRAVIEHNLLYDGRKRLWYSGPMFRHERPQKGRYRQFHQFGVEALGFAGPDIDAEQIVMCAATVARRSGSKGITLELNTLGRPRARARIAHGADRLFREASSTLLDEDSQRRLHTNPLRILDSKNPAMQDRIAGAPKLVDYLGAASRAHFEARAAPALQRRRAVRGQSAARARARLLQPDRVRVGDGRARRAGHRLRAADATTD